MGQSKIAPIFDKKKIEIEICWPLWPL